MGTAEDPLDLYVLIDGRNVGYASLAPETNFQVLIPKEESSGQTLRVDLVQGGTIWHTVELPLIVD